MKYQKGFTLIELMVVIVIIGILSALAIPKMFGVSAKAKAAEAPGVIANWETLQSAYAQETGTAGTFAQIGFQNPNTTMSSKWFTYTAPAVTSINAEVSAAFGDCAAGDDFTSVYDPATDANTRTTSMTACSGYVPNYCTTAGC